MNSTGCTARRKSRLGLKGSNRSNECRKRYPAGARCAAVRGRRRDHGRARRHRIADDPGRLFDKPNCLGNDVAVEADSHNGLGGLLLWINAGRLPLLILIILALGVFSIEGFLLQGIAHMAWHCHAGRDRRACGGRRQRSRDPDHQPRHRPHHPARRDLCGQRRRFRRQGRHGFDRTARSGTARPGSSQGCLRQLAHCVGTRQSRFAGACGRRQRACWSTATPGASSPFPHPPTSSNTNDHQTGHKNVGSRSTR